MLAAGACKLGIKGWITGPFRMSMSCHRNYHTLLGGSFHKMAAESMALGRAMKPPPD